jgi:DNA-binding NarL/FixJ family response regulator
MKSKTNFLLIEDETLIREGIIALLEKEPFTGKIFEASGKTDLAKVSITEVNVILIDFRLRGCNAIDLIPSLKEKCNAKIIVVTGLEGNEVIVNLLGSGVQAIVHKLDGYQEIRTAIQYVLRNELYFPPQIMKIIHSHAGEWAKTPPVCLSFAEKELILAISSGLTTKQIAVQLRMTEATTETYRLRLIKKLGMPNTAAMMAYAFKNGIL